VTALVRVIQQGIQGIAMRNWTPISRLRSAAAMAVALALLVGMSSVGARAEDDEENVPIDTKILRRFMKDWGLRRGDEPGIDYRERAPLVVPPSRNLPPPQEEVTGSVANNPAWPTDPDVNRRKKEAAAERARLKAGFSAEEQQRALRRDELDAPGRKASDGTPAAAGRTAEDSQRLLSPEELGSTNVFSKLFSSFGPSKTEIAPFTGEPPRASMTAPPTGYQTPSPNQPYGLGPARDKYAVPKPEDKAVGDAQK
jgi:hypothetical protein